VGSFFWTESCITPIENSCIGLYEVINPITEYLLRTAFRRVKMSSVSNSRSAFELLKNQFNPDAEEFWGLFLNNHLEVIDCKLIHRGTVDSCTVHPRDLFREAIKLNSCAIIIAHNHPSRSLDPSTSDIQLTRKFKKIGTLIQIPIIDHMIFSDSNYYSFKEHFVL
jgi:DNA repair protein RadC